MNLILSTARLILEPFIQDGDEKLIYNTFTNPYVRKFLWDDQMISEEVAKGIFEKNKKHFEDDFWGLWKIKIQHDGSFIGFVGLWYFFDEEQPQLLYGLLPDFKGYGYATEASLKVLHYAFEKLGFSYMVASCDKNNLPSHGVCLRLGMVYDCEKVIDDKPTVFYSLDK